MNVLYHLTILPPKMPQAEALSQEISALQSVFGGDLLYLNPNISSPIYLPRLLFGFHKLPELRRREAQIDLHHVYNPDPFPFPILRFLRKPVVYSLSSGVGEKRPNIRFLSRLTAVTVPDERGYQREEWWQGLAKQPTPRPPMWSYANHPRETVSWYEAMAFCRWLEARLRERGELPEGGQVRLPSEREWEKAARGSDGREFPWGEFQPGHANMDEQWDGVGPYNLAQTSAVGIYPQGASPYEVLELAGNVWEWCADKFDEPGDIDPGGKGRRVVSGGSWGGSRDSARCACRDADGPRDRYHDLGFRVVCVSPIR